jgi:hypothetical protein
MICCLARRTGPVVHQTVYTEKVEIQLLLASAPGWSGVHRTGYVESMYFRHFGGG